MIAETTIYGDWGVVHEGEGFEIRALSGPYGQIVEIIYGHLASYCMPDRAIEESTKGARYMDSQVNPDSGALAVWYWKGIDGGKEQKG